MLMKALPQQCICYTSLSVSCTASDLFFSIYCTPIMNPDCAAACITVQPYNTQTQ